MRQIGPEPFCKTTGGQGLPVVTPLADAAPDSAVLNMSKAKRTGRIVLDNLRNDRMATAVAPYSPRAREGAPVSMPLKWTQVRKGLDPMAYTVRTVADLRAKGDPWEGYEAAAKPLKSAIGKLAKR